MKRLGLLVAILFVAAAAFAQGTYTVKAGDTLEKIAKRFNCKVDALARKNGITNAKRLQIGQVLRLPTDPSSYKDGKVPQLAKPNAKQTSSSGSTKTATISKDKVNVRAKPTTSSKSLVQVEKGRTATVLGEESGWYKLQFPGGTVGYVRKDMVTIAAATKTVAKQAKQAPNVPPTGSTVTITSDDVILRAGPSTKQPVVAKLRKGVEAKVIGRHGQWLKVSFPGGATGFVHGSLTSAKETVAASAPPAVDRSDLITTARRYLGVRYVYGGETSRGFDCSGFVYFLYRTVEGITLPRTSSEQAGSGTAVKKEDLQPGDLVFFRTGRSTRINHAGIYIGDGNFIHASSGGGVVKIDSLTTGYYAARFVTARRIEKK
jgi:cell wall-associated NlpC family hydrolase